MWQKLVKSSEELDRARKKRICFSGNHDAISINGVSIHRTQLVKMLNTCSISIEMNAKYLVILLFVFILKVLHAGLEWTSSKQL